MITQKNKIIIISSCTTLVIVLGIICTFFGYFISSIKSNKHIKTIKDNLSNQLFNKWIFMGFILNCLIILSYLTMKLQINKGEKGEIGIIGDIGDIGDTGKDSATCEECK